MLLAAAAAAAASAAHELSEGVTTAT